MTSEQLKASILQMAIRGKLVEQCPEDGTAEDLYQQILEEKQKLIKDGRIKKEKPLAEITEDEIPFDIPESWYWTRLGSICENLCDGVHFAPKYIESGIPCYSAKDINNDRIMDINTKYISEEDYYSLMEYKIQTRKGSLLVTKSGSIGRSVVIDNWYKFGLVESVGVVNPIFVNPHYIKIVLDYGFVYTQNLYDTYTNGIAVKHFTLSSLSNVVLPIPPLAEQHRIVAKIEELLPYVDRYAEAYEKLEQFNAKFPEDMKKSILQYAIQGKLVEQRPEEGTGEELYRQIQDEKQKLIKEGKIKKEKPLAEIAEDEIPFDIPDSWKWVRWGNLSQNIQYGYNAPARQQGRIRMVRISDIQNEKVEWKTVPYCDIPEVDVEAYLLKKNDILFARTGGTVGKSFLVDEVLEEAIFAGYLIRSSYSEKICPKYIKFFMGTKLYWDQLRNGTIATAQPNCNGQTLSKMILPLPPFEEQERIVAKIEELLPYCDTLVKGIKA